MVHLGSEKLVATEGANDDVETGHDGEGLSQEVAVLHELVLGDISEGRELLLVFRMLLQESFGSMIQIYNEIETVID